MTNATRLALKILFTSLTNVLSKASVIACRKRPSPSPKPILIKATPLLRIVVSTSAKSTFCSKSVVTISAILLAAIVNVSSALRFACGTGISAKFLNRSLLITKSESTFCAIFLTPRSAFTIFGRPSKTKGIVTIPTVKIPISLEILATTGPAPVPVPPPIPAVTKAIRVPSSNIRLMSSLLSKAAFSPTSGTFPEPSPCVVFCPISNLLGTSDFCNAWLSVLHNTKDTSRIPSRYILLTALPPPPPTPITLMIV